MTRAAPARLLGLADRGHLAPGARADIAVYRPTPDLAAMFRHAELVFKDGRLVVRQGTPIGAPTGHALAVQPGFDASIERRLGRWYDHVFGVSLSAFDVVASDPERFEAVACRRMTRNGVRIDDTFAEAFDMRGTALLITAGASRWARQAAMTMTGFATSVIACGCEAAIDRELRRRSRQMGAPASVCCCSRPRPANCRSSFRRGSGNAC